jgi:putative ABC transport system permease protein
MRNFKALVQTRIAPLALPPDREQKIVDEWGTQLEEMYDALRAAGSSDEEAWRELHAQIPDAEALAGELLDAEPMLVRLASPASSRPGRGTPRRMLRLIHGMFAAGFGRDVRASLRLLVKDAGFSATVVLTLAICLGANAAIFSVVDAVLLRPLPAPESDRIVGFGDVYPTITPNDILASDVPSYFDRRVALTTIDEHAMFTFWFDTIAINGVAQELRGMRVTPSLFTLLRVPPVLGRTFTDAEGETGADRKVILSYALWQQLYGGDATVVGRDLRLGWTGERYTIVGVMPRDFSFFDRGFSGRAAESDDRVQFWLPLAFTPEQKSDNARARYGFYHIARLRPGATLEQVQAEVAALHAQKVERFPQFNFAELGMYTAVTPLQDALTRGIRRPLYLLWTGAAFVLLIGAINIGNLSVARASARRRELATRLALGAGRLQVARQLMIEAIVPAMLGGAAGLAVGAGILRALAIAGLASLPQASAITMDARTILVVALSALMMGGLIGAVPAATGRAAAINQALGEGSRSNTGGRRARLFRRALVVTQVALSLVLLIAATLLFTSVRHLLGLDAGVARAGVVTATIFPPPSRYPDAAAVAGLLDQLLERVRTNPGVQATGITSNIALSGFESPSTVSPADRRGSDEGTAVPSVVAVSPGYFEAMSTRLVRGRDFTPSDRADAPRVAILDEALARRLWPREDPIGKAIFRGDDGPYTIVGIVREVRFEGLTGSIESIGTAYFAHTQAPPLRRLRWIAVKSTVEPAVVVRALRLALRQLDPDLPLADVQTMEQRASASLAPQRLAMTLAMMFAGVALFLSMLGIYGVLATLVARRTREIGIRMALGSTVRAIFYLVLSEGVLLIVAGVVLGLAGAVAVAQTLEGLVFGVGPTDPFVLGTVASVTSAMALLACVMPARRATRVDPVQVLSEP